VDIQDYEDVDADLLMIHTSVQDSTRFTRDLAQFLCKHNEDITTVESIIKVTTQGNFTITSINE
jgi:hypothetical protein